MRQTLPILVIGGGIGGMSAAIALSQRGFTVELVEMDPQWRVYGAGITITGPTYRAFAELGFLDELLACGFGARGASQVFAADGSLLGEVPGDRLRPNLPVIGGIMRPKLHELLSRRTVGCGVKVRLGVSYVDWHDRDSDVFVSFTDKTSNSYAAVIVADGAFSKTRRHLFADAPEPKYTGQYCWRLVAERPADIDRAHIYMGNGVYAGLVPTSDTSMYLWLLETQPERGRIDEERLPELLAQHMAPFRGILGELRRGLNDGSLINCRPLDYVLLPRPWFKGRAILIGDAAHSTTPHLASGAGIAVEDAIVLAALLAASHDLQAVFSTFMDLRWERCRDVVESSVAIGRSQQAGVSPAAVGEQIGVASHRLCNDIWGADLQGRVQQLRSH